MRALRTTPDEGLRGSTVEVEDKIHFTSGKRSPPLPKPVASEAPDFSFPWEIARREERMGKSKLREAEAVFWNPALHELRSAYE
jgi:hypothetical protein